MTTALAVTLHNLVHEMDSLADTVLQQRLGMTVGLFVFLTPLAEGTMDLTQLATALNLTRAATSKRVPSLEKAGWVTTSSDPNHKRRVLVSLTPRAETAIREGLALLSSGFDKMANDTPEVDGESLNTSLLALLRTVKGFNLQAHGFDA